MANTMGVHDGRGGGEREGEGLGSSSAVNTDTSSEDVVIIHNCRSQILDDSTTTWLQERGFERTQNEPKKDEWTSNSFSVEMQLNPCLKQNLGRSCDTIDLEIEMGWCQFTKTNSNYNHLWLETKSLHPSASSLNSPKHKVIVSSLSLGTFPSAGRYLFHWEDGDASSAARNTLRTITTSFDHELQSVVTKYEYNTSRWKLHTSYDSMEKFILVTFLRSTFHIYLFLSNQPKVFRARKPKDDQNPEPKSVSDVLDENKTPETEEFLWKRDTRFGHCQMNVIGSSNVLHLQTNRREENNSVIQVLARFQKLGFSILFGVPAVQRVTSHQQFSSPFSSCLFKLSWAWFCLTSRGFKVTDQVDDEFLDLLQKNSNEPWLEAAIKALTIAVDKRSICPLKDQFLYERDRIIQDRRNDLDEEDKEDDDGSSVAHIVASRRIILTPTTIRGLAEEWSKENRVLREFGVDRFIRVSIRDEDFQQLSGAYGPLGRTVERIIEFLSEGIKVGNRHFRFLGCSNSQLRARGVWMYASDEQGNTVESIRKWMGDLSHERCVATYVARLGQCFSSTQNTVEVNDVKTIDDIFRETKYCFTDGIGKISRRLAEKVSKAMNKSYTPSAFQIRFGGCKGVVSIAPDLGEETEKLQIRKSMEKFKCKHNKLEVCDVTKPGRLHLNRQAILLLSGLGIPDESFYSLQESMLQKMADMLIFENKAIDALSVANLGIKPKHLKESGIIVTLEPFLRSVLAMIYRHQFDGLMERTKIDIPDDKGRIMMGTVDESGCLEYDEVFVQYSERINKPHKNIKVLTGQVVVTKNPCFHPGDMRKFKAVDRNELHHMVDCIVFPAKGPRPPPNEISGSDLDGDMYFVCWQESLIPKGKNREPMDFSALEKQVNLKPVTEKDMIDFIGHYMESDQLGVIANAHLVHADSKGIDCWQCLDIARLHSDAVDFPKTGQANKMSKELRPLSYPYYMAKSDKPLYISNTVIAKLYYQCRAIKISSNFKRSCQKICLDPSLLLEGYEMYVEKAKLIKATYEKRIIRLMAMFKIESEAELLSVSVLKIKRGLGLLKNDQYEIREIIRIHIERIKAKMRSMFYEEFGKETFSRQDANVLRKASALYFVSYGPTSNVTAAEDEEENRCLGLPWIFADVLCSIKKQNHLRVDLPVGINFIYKSFLHKISCNTKTVGIKLAERCNEERMQRISLFKRLCQISDEHAKETRLTLFGSTVTTCDSDKSTVDIFVDVIRDSLNPEEDSISRCHLLATEFAKESSGEVSVKKANKRTEINLYEKNVQINLFSSSDFLHRTVYIASKMVMNKWTIPALNVILEWGRNSGIVGNKGAILKTEELVLMLFAVILDERQCDNLISEATFSESLALLSKNHFLSCPVTSCDHVEKETLQENPDELFVANEGLSDLSLCEKTPRCRILADDIDEEHKLGMFLIKFFDYCGSTRGDSLKNMRDPCSKVRGDKLLKLKDPEYVQLAEKMSQAYHSLANSEGINDFLNPECLNNKYFTDNLPTELSSILMYKEAQWAKKLMTETGSEDINIRQKRFRGSDLPGHFLEAWGNSTAMIKLNSRLQNWISNISLFTPGMAPGSRTVISDAYKTVFEGSTGRTSELRMKPYDGRCQNVDNRHLKQYPYLRSEYADSTNSSVLGQVVKLFEEQREFMNKAYDPAVNGGMRVSISIGNFYLKGFKIGRNMTTAELVNLLTRKVISNKSAHVDQCVPHSRQDKAMSKTPYTHTSPQTSSASLLFYNKDHRQQDMHRQQEFRWSRNVDYTMPRNPTMQHEWPRQAHYSQFGNSNIGMQNFPKTSTTPQRFRNTTSAMCSNYIPVNDVQKERLEKFLKQHSFIETAHRYEYRATVKMKVAHGIIVVDEKSDLTLFHLQDEKWFVLNVFRGKTGEKKQPKDIRIQFHSRPLITAAELAERENCQDLLDNAHHLLHKNQNGEVDGIDFEAYKSRINYMRYKDMTSYKFNGNPAKDDEGGKFLNRMTIKVNRGKEYRWPNQKGIFHAITDQSEVIAETTDLPDLRNDEECAEFMRQIYQFSKEFAKAITD